MCKKLFAGVAVFLLAGLTCSVGCGVGHGNTVTKGDEKAKQAHQQRAMEDPQSTVGLGKPGE